MTDSHVESVVAVLELIRNATVDHVQALTMKSEATPEWLEAKLVELKETPLAFIAQLDPNQRVQFVRCARKHFMGTDE